MHKTQLWRTEQQSIMDIQENTVPLLLQDEVLIVPIQGDLDDDQAKLFQEALLAKISKCEVHEVLIDISNLETIDLYLARLISSTAKMLVLMDVETVVAGMRPANAIILAEMGVSLDGLRLAPNMNTGIAILKDLRQRVETS